MQMLFYINITNKQQQQQQSVAKAEADADETSRSRESGGSRDRDRDRGRYMSRGRSQGVTGETGQTDEHIPITSLCCKQTAGRHGVTTPL